MKAGSRPWRISVDTGGTFTDVFALAPDGSEHHTKLLSSATLRARVQAVEPKAIIIDRSFGAPDGLFVGYQLAADTAKGQVIEWDSRAKRLRVDSDFRIAVGDIVDLSTGEEIPVLATRLLTSTPLGHPLPPIELRLATTRGTNALLEQTGTPPVLFLPLGFSDLLEIGDQRRADLFARRHGKRRLPLATTIEVSGRIDCDGDEMEPLDLDSLRAEICRIPAELRGTAAVALFNSYLDPSQEQEMASILADAGFGHVSCSSEMSASIRLLPRAQTAVADAYLAPLMRRFVDEVGDGIGSGFWMMTSSGGLVPSDEFRPKDGLLSGPAGGLEGARAAARACGIGQFIAFDMGGTSTDVARVGDDLPYVFEHRVGDATVMAPSLHIETVAAGGGSICSVTSEGLVVGPGSAGADPGPACYGRGGPLTLTDVNLLMGRLDPESARIPLDANASQSAFAELKDEMQSHGLAPAADTALLETLLQIAVERMGEAIRKISIREGYDPREHALIAFGGAGPQHACAVADSLGIDTVLVPGEAGLLSARGVAAATRRAFKTRSILRPLSDVRAELDGWFCELETQARASLAQHSSPDALVYRRMIELRLEGQEAALEFEVSDPVELAAEFAQRFEHLYGYTVPERRSVEAVTIRVSAAERELQVVRESFAPSRHVESLEVESGAFATLVAEAGWHVATGSLGSRVLKRGDDNETGMKVAQAEKSALSLELTRYRLAAIVEEMGATLRRCAISTNVRERQDFSCAILDAGGRLAINAPHIPVHLGALGLCVRELVKTLPLGRGDMLVTNHPAFGGSHLPDVTVICGVFSTGGKLIAYLANRAHHAEIGGVAPGSMPPSASCLAEEGVVIPPSYLFKAGEARFEAIRDKLNEPPHPSRNPEDNLADLQAQAAALLSAQAALESHDPALVQATLVELTTRSAKVAARKISGLSFERRQACELLDDGSPLAVELQRSGASLSFDFTGTAGVLPYNLNATPAIVQSAILYVLRLLLDEDLPLNEGFLDSVSITLPDCLLNPCFDSDPLKCPPVVGGNVETSQRLVDLLIKALEIQAGSQGTMNNLLFGNADFGYYETIAGGAGAGDGYRGASALHTHMTNTAITDPEVLEWRYPVRLLQFAVRQGSGGSGRYRGGDGVVREFEFLEPLTVSFLAEHRKERPFGLAGGTAGAAGSQQWTDPDGNVHAMSGRFSKALPAGARVRIETPGGGGFGKV